MNIKKLSIIIFIVVMSAVSFHLEAQHFDYHLAESPAISWNGVQMFDACMMAAGGISLMASEPFAAAINPALVSPFRGKVERALIRVWEDIQDSINISQNLYSSDTLYRPTKIYWGEVRDYIRRYRKYTFGAFFVSEEEIDLCSNEHLPAMLHFADYFISKREGQGIYIRKTGKERPQVEHYKEKKRRRK